METCAIFFMKAKNLHKLSLLWSVFWQPQLPHPQKDKWPVLCQAPKTYRNAFTLHQLLEGVTSAEPNQWFTWLRMDNWEQAPKCHCISAEWTPTAPDCACPLRSHWWAVPDVVPAPDPSVWNMHTTSVCQVCSEALVPGPGLVLVCSGRLCLLFMCLQGTLLSCQLRLHFLVSYTPLLTLAYRLLNLKKCLYFFPKHIICFHQLCYLTLRTLPLCPLAILVTMVPYWHRLPLKGSTDLFRVLKFSIDPWTRHKGRISFFLLKEKMKAGERLIGSFSIIVGNW